MTGVPAYTMHCRTCCTCFVRYEQLLPNGDAYITLSGTTTYGGKSILLCTIMDFSHYSLAHFSPNIPHGLGNGPASSNQNSLSDNLAALNTIDASGFWQAQYQHVQAKNNKMEIDMGFIKCVRCSILMR